MATEHIKETKETTVEERTVAEQPGTTVVEKRVVEETPRKPETVTIETHTDG